MVYKKSVKGERERDGGWGVFFFSFPRSFASLTIERQTDRQTEKVWGGGGGGRLSFNTQVYRF